MTEHGKLLKDVYDAKPLITKEQVEEKYFNSGPFLLEDIECIIVINNIYTTDSSWSIIVTFKDGGREYSLNGRLKVVKVVADGFSYRIGSYMYSTSPVNNSRAISRNMWDELIDMGLTPL